MAIDICESSKMPSLDGHFEVLHHFLLIRKKEGNASRSTFMSIHVLKKSIPALDIKLQRCDLNV
jgi:hypothetical protein